MLSISPSPSSNPQTPPTFHFYPSASSTTPMSPSPHPISSSCETAHPDTQTQIESHSPRAAHTPASPKISRQTHPSNAAHTSRSPGHIPKTKSPHTPARSSAHPPWSSHVAAKIDDSAPTPLPSHDVPPVPSPLRPLSTSPPSDPPLILPPFALRPAHPRRHHHRQPDHHPRPHSSPHLTPPRATIYLYPSCRIIKFRAQIGR